MNPITNGSFEARMDYILASPKDRGELKLIVVRPDQSARLIKASCHLSLKGGAEGDHWAKGCWRTLPDGRPDPNVQITLMNYRVLEGIAADDEARAMAGDNLCVDLDLSDGNLACGDRLRIGEAVLEITEVPHNGCVKFKARFGAEALAGINSARGKALHLRGIYARVVQDGVVAVGDCVEKLRRF